MALKLLIGIMLSSTTIFSSQALGQTADAKPKTCQARFEGNLTAIFDDDGRHLTLVEPYSFTDTECEKWSVPKKASFDGATIPSSLWSLVGGPLEGKYRNASVIHDWFCDKRTRSWQKVHRMFYDGMIAAGVSKIRAKLMYWAVYVGGPRWSIATIKSNKIDITSCPACASVSGSANDMDSGAIKSDSNLSINRKVNITFSHKIPEITPDKFELISEKIRENPSISIDDIEKFGNDYRPAEQRCPINYIFNNVQGICLKQ